MKELFLQILKDTKALSERSSDMYRATNGMVSFMDYDDAFHKLLNAQTLHIFGELALEYMQWWLYEDVEKVIYNADDTVCAVVVTPNQLYDYLKEICGWK